VAAQRAIAIKSDYADAYNNMGVAYQNLKDYAKAIEAYKKAISINPDFALAKNNLAATEALASGGNTVTEKPAGTAEDFLNLSVTYYNQGSYALCIEAAAKSISIKPNASAYSNMCAAYNQLKQYDKAILAGNEALKLDPNHTLAKGNLKYALDHKK
jgi:tetratricopeptide (TPR) repeat protein